MDAELRQKLENVAVATLTTVMFKKGIATTWIKGSAPYCFTGKRVVGPAFTMRYAPAREDLATPEAWKSPTSTRAAIEDMPEGCVCVIDSRGEDAAGVMGDILAARMKKRGVAAMVTDGVMRDSAGVKAVGLPIWCNGTAAPAAVHKMAFVGWQEPIGCGGTTIFPDDIIVADDDGAVVIPKAMVEDVADAAVAQDHLEAWIVTQVEEGYPLPGLYPPNDETMARYEDFKKNGG
ncbi:ribonuclease activity regulator RraA [Thalassospiraceae bacterium LMO-JJ14]|nr:ribonuclease activity regulator RraA [Thalassospiraceae bacterium LMO-JJ14]